MTEGDEQLRKNAEENRADEKNGSAAKTEDASRQWRDYH